MAQSTIDTPAKPVLTLGAGVEIQVEEGNDYSIEVGRGSFPAGR